VPILIIMNQDKTDIFISYRHSDSAASARSIRDRLVLHFEHVYLDVSNIKPGENFVQDIHTALSSCNTLLVIIGKDWLEASNEHGRRLEQPNDIVRLEILTAYSIGANIIPVLVDEATMPEPADLPEQLTWLSLRNALRIRHEQFDSDIKTLAQRLREYLSPTRSSSSRDPNDITGTWEGTITREQGKKRQHIKCRYVFLESPSSGGAGRHYKYRVEYLGIMTDDDLIGPKQSMYGTVTLKGNELTPTNLPPQAEKMNAAPWVHFNMTLLDPKTIKGHFGYRLKVLWLDKKMYWTTLLINKTSNEVDPYYRNAMNAERLNES